jgi:hypothetical protein
MAGNNTDYQFMASLVTQDFNTIFYASIGLPERLSEIKAEQALATRPIAQAALGRWNAPSDVDIQGLANEIWFLRQEYPRWVRLDSDAEARRKHARLIRLEKALGDVSTLYSQDGPWLDNRLFSSWREDVCVIRAFEEARINRPFHGLHDLMDGVRFLQSLVQRVIDQNAQDGFDKLSEHPLTHLNPTRLLVLTISRLAQKYLNLDDKISRTPDEGRLGGPFMRFSKAVFSEIGCDLSTESIAKAVMQNRKGTARKRR